MLYGVHCKKNSTFGKKLTIVEQLKLLIIKEWINLSQRFIDRSIIEWRQSLEYMYVVEKQEITLNMFSDYPNTWQTTVYEKTIILNNSHVMTCY